MEAARLLEGNSDVIRSRGVMTIPSEVADLTPAWFSTVLPAPVTAVEVVDAHSGTTGRARVRLTTAAPVPDTLFVKLQPFVPEQREFLRMVGLGVAEAQLYAAVGDELPVRVPRVWHASFDDGNDSFVMVLEDLVASGCRFPSPTDDDVLDRAISTVEELAKLHAAYWERELPWLRVPPGFGGDGRDEKANRRGGKFIQLALEKFVDDMPPAFRQLGELYVARSADVVSLWNEGERTLIHGDSHMGNLFVDGGRTGFYDWAVASRSPGMRDVAYFLCNSVPPDLRRAEEASLLERYRAGLAAGAVALDERTAHEQYRLFSVYSWVAASSTAAMGSRWQPVHVGQGGMQRATEAIADLDAVGLLTDRLGKG
jgi:aminoglycoside phosphotransferase (APT) family kinase protein